MSIIQLPLYDTKYTSVPNITNLASVLEMHEEGRCWFIENHLNLAAFVSEESETQFDRRKFWIDFSALDPFYIGRSWELCWLVRKKTHLRSFIDSNYTAFHDFCIDSINAGNYLFLTVNTEYISEYSFQWRHQIFIHGYNNENKTLYCSDFFGNPSKYQRLWIPYEEVDNGYLHLFDISSIDDFEGVCLWNYNEDTFSFCKDFGCTRSKTLDYDIIYGRISAFLEGKSDALCLSPSANLGYGVTALSWLRNYIISKIEAGFEVNMQPLYVAKDHLLVIGDLLATLQSDKYNIDSTKYENLVRLIGDSIRLTMKCNEYLRRKIAIRDERKFKLYELLNELINEECILLSEICNAIR